MKLIKIFVLLLTITAFVSCSEDTLDYKGSGKIMGTVVEAKNFNPIKNAKVTVTPSNNTVLTDEEGKFTFEDIETGEYSVSVEKESFMTSYEPASVTAGSEIKLILEMSVETATNRPPSTPKLITPEDNSTDQKLLVELAWQSIDPDQDSIKYKLKIKNDLNDKIDVIEELTDTTYVLSKLAFGTKYFWQVSATDEINEEVWSPISSFETIENNEFRFLYVRKEDENNIIYSSNKEGDSIQLTSEYHNSWRPRKNATTNTIAYLKTDNFETHLYTMNLDGTGQFKVTSVPVEGFRQSELDFSWSQTGDKLIYPNFDKLYQINRDGSGLELLYQTPDGSFITECDWSYDEAKIALKTNNQSGYNSSIYVIDMSGNTLNTVLSNAKGAVGGINFSIDGQKLLYTLDVSDYQDDNYRQLDTNIFLYNFATNASSNLSEDKDGGTLDLDPRFSPNDAEIIFVNTSNDGISQKNIYKMSVKDDGGGDREELFEKAVMPDWE